MSQQKRTYTNEFKQDAVELWKSSGRTAAEFEAELSITHGLLTKWKSRANSSGQAACPVAGIRQQNKLRFDPYNERISA